MPSVGLKSTTWNVPVPCGFVLIVAGGTWHGETSDPPEASSARNGGCARFRWKVASIVPSAVTLSRLLYQAARGLLRSFLPSRPATRSQVHFTSAAVKGSPSCHLTPSRSLQVSFVRSSFHAQLSARSGRIVSRLLRRSSWSYTTDRKSTRLNSS